MTSDTDFDAAAFSRSTGLFAGAGNADAVIKFRMSFEESDELRVLARSEGMTVSEYLRVLVKLRLHGEKKVLSMAANQLQRVAGNGTEKGPE